MKRYLLPILGLFSLSTAISAAEVLSFDCKRYENNFLEEYVMKIMPASKAQKAKVFLDDRDLDQTDQHSSQAVKSLLITQSSIVIYLQTRFDPEVLEGVRYSAGTVFAQLMLDRSNGKLKKVEVIEGGILGANLGNGTHVSEELCMPAKSN